METTQEKTLNGVPTDRLVETMQAIRKQPEIAKFKFRAKNRWDDGARNVATVGAFHGALEEHPREEPFEYVLDEHPVLLGGDTGGNPVEYLLTALSGCLTTSLVYHAAARGIEVTGVESSYEGDIDLHGFLGMDESVRPGYQEIRVTMKVEADVSEEIKDELVQAAKDHSPVYDVVSNGTRVEVVRAR
jgi:uncharacterized OsmC-like protein